MVDVKTPLDAYLTAAEATTDEDRDLALRRHALAVQERVRQLSQKAYWSQFEQSPDLVVLFIPGDQFLSAAVAEMPSLLEDAIRQHVIIATPTSFVALLKAVAYGWRQNALAENAAHIQELGEDLYKRLATFTAHISKVGRTLGQSVEAYNAAVGSLERQVMPGARKFTELGLRPAKEIEERATRPMEKLLWEIPGVEYVYSTSQPSGGMLIVRYKVGTDPDRAALAVHTKLAERAAGLPPGAAPPLVVPRGIDDVPVVGYTLWSTSATPLELRQVAQELSLIHI